MALTGTPSTAAKTTITDTGTPTTSGGTVTQAITLGGDTQWTVGTGSGVSMNVVISGSLTLAVSTPVDLDLSSYIDAVGTKVLTKVRGFEFDHQGIADSNGTITITSSAADGFVGGAITTTGFVLNPNSSVYQTNRNAAGWTRDASHKKVTLDPGATQQAIKFAIWGE